MTESPAELKLLHLLYAINRARDSLPLLLRTFSTPIPPPKDILTGTGVTNPSFDRSLVYHSRSQVLNSSIKTLSNELKECQDLLNQCEKSEKEDGKGIVVRARKISSENGEGWEKLGEVVADSAIGKGKRKWEGTLGEIDGGQEGLERWINKWEDSNRKKIQVELIKGGKGKEYKKIKLVLTGVMRASVMLHWRKGVVKVERVACFGLKEVSQFSLFQGITNSCMDKIGRDNQTGSNLEEILDFLANPPLPF